MHKDLRDYLRKYSRYEYEEYLDSQPKSINEIVDGFYLNTAFGKIFVAKKEYLLIIIMEIYLLKVI